MSAVLCMQCGVTSEPFGDFGPGGVVWRCGNINGCKDPNPGPDNGAPTAIVHPGGAPDAPPQAQAAARVDAPAIAQRLLPSTAKPLPPRKLDDMLAELQARRNYVAAEIALRQGLEAELAKLDTILTGCIVRDSGEA